jgi:hypothetical protein
VIVFEPHTGSHCFRVKFFNPNEKVYGISILYPSDIYENKNGYPTIIETALIDTEGQLCYVEEHGYYDVCR